MSGYLDIPTARDLAELALLAGDRGLLMNPPDQWADPPDSEPVISHYDLAAHEVADQIAREMAQEARQKKAREKAAATARWRRARIRWRAAATVQPHPVPPEDATGTGARVVRVGGGTLTVWQTGWRWTLDEAKEAREPE